MNPGYSGLTTANVMRATFDAGIRFVVGDTSVAGYDNPSPNAGIYNPLQPQILMIPRRPTNLFYNVSTPDQWMAEYNDIYRSFWGRDLSYAEILDNESDVLAQYLLKGENDPWMFHQPDLRDLRLGAEPARRSARRRRSPSTRRRVTTPLISPPMDDLGRAGRGSHALQRVRRVGHRRSQRQHHHRARRNAAVVPVTGACGGSNEFYAGQPIASVNLPAGGSATLSLSSGACAGAGGTGGRPDGRHGGTAGTGRAARRHSGRPARAARRRLGVALPCNALSVVAGQIGPGQSASALTVAELTGTTGRRGPTTSRCSRRRASSATTCCRRARAPARVTALALDVNYRGPSKTTMTWTFEVLDSSHRRRGRCSATTRSPPSWVWTKNTFTLPAPLARFFSGGTLQIRYGTTSSADASDIDQLLIRATIGSGGTGTAGTTGAAGRPARRDGRHGRHGRDGRHRRLTGAAFRCRAARSAWRGSRSAPASGRRAHHRRADRDDGRVDQLRRGVPVVAHRLQLRAAVGRGRRGDVAGPAGQLPRARSNATALDVRGARHGTGAWTLLGDNTFAGDWVWTKHTFTLPAPLARFFSSGRRCRSATARPAAPTPRTSTSC